MFISDYIEIRESNLHGLGVFAKKDIPARTKVEVSPGILLTKKPQNKLFKYCYSHNQKPWAVLFPLGYLGLYNSSSNPNIRVSVDCDKNLITVTTKVNINKGEELLHDYEIFRKKAGDLTR
tara:strand:+ start:316 stop:678 length:363 start_codon:yes stop_codon:yes gene_type:complete